MLWAHLESNQAPTDYESVALTEWAIGPNKGIFPTQNQWREYLTDLGFGIAMLHIWVELINWSLGWKTGLT